MPITREQMDYNTAAQQFGAEVPTGGFDSGQEKYIYDSVVIATRDELLKQRAPDGTPTTVEEANLTVLEAYPDGYEAIGVDKPAPNQDYATSIEGFQEYVTDTQGSVDGQVRAKEAIDSYTKELKDNVYKYPSLRGTDKSALNKHFENLLDTSGLYTLEKLRGYQPPRQDNTEKTDVKTSKSGTMSAIVDSFVDSTDGVITGLSQAASSAASFNDALYRQAAVFYKNLGQDNPIVRAMNEYEVLNTKTTFDRLKERFDPSDIIEGDVDTFAGKIIQATVPILIDIGIATAATTLPGGQVYGAKKLASLSTNTFNYLTKVRIADAVASTQAKLIGASQVVQVGGQMIQEYRGSVKKGDLDINSELGLLALSPVLGAIEAIPSALVLKASNLQLLKQLDTALGGNLISYAQRIGSKLRVGPKIRTGTRTLVNLTGESLVGASSEIVSEMAQNFIASDVIAYDEERSLFSGTKEAGELGFAVQFFLNGMFKAKGALTIQDIKGRVADTRPEVPEEISELVSEKLKDKDFFIDGDGNKTLYYPDSGVEIITDVENIFKADLSKIGSQLITLNNDVNSDFILPRGTKVLVENSGYSVKNGEVLLEGFDTPKDAVDNLVFKMQGNISKTEDYFGVNVERDNTLFDNAHRLRVFKGKLDVEEALQSLRDTGATIYSVGENTITAGYRSKIPFDISAVKGKVSILKHGETVPYRGSRVNYLSRQSFEKQPVNVGAVQNYLIDKGFVEDGEGLYKKENILIELKDQSENVVIDIFDTLNSDFQQVGSVEINDLNGIENSEIYSDIRKQVKDINTKLVENNIADKDIEKDSTGVNIDDIDYGDTSEIDAVFNEASTEPFKTTLARKYSRDVSNVQVTDTGMIDVGRDNVDIEYRVRDEIGDYEKVYYQARLEDQLTRIGIDNDVVSGRLESQPFDDAELQPYLDALPRDIVDFIELTSAPGNLAEQSRAYGLFDSKTRKILIDTRFPLEEVVRTIAHETQHFGTSFWAGQSKDFLNTKTGKMVPALTKMYEELYKINEKEILERYHDYIGDQKITENLRYDLVNEYLADIGMDTSQENFLQRETEFSGLSKEKVREIGQILNDGKKNLKIDLTARSEDMTAEQAEAFATSILSAQVQTLFKRNFSVELIYDSQGDRRKFIVTPTPYGTRTIDSAFTDDTQRWENVKRRGRLAEGDRTRISNKFYRFYLNNIAFSEGALGREMNRLVTEGIFTARSKGARQLKPFLDLLSTLDAFMLDKNISVQDVVNNSYSLAFKRKLGELTPKQQQLALDADKAMSELLDMKKEGVGKLKSIRNETTKFIADRIEIEERSGVRRYARNYVNRAKAVIENDFLRFSEEWDSRLYNAFREEDLDNIRRMRDALEVSDDTPDLEADRIEAEKELSVERTKDNPDYLKINELNNTIKLSKRLRALRRATELKLQENLNTKNITTNEIDASARRYIDNITGTTSGGSRSKLANSYRSRTLSPDNEKDANYIEFLDPVINPLQIAVSNIANQREVIDQYQIGNGIAKAALDKGMAQLKLEVSQSTEDSGRSEIAKIPLTKSSLLNFVEFDKAFENVVDDMTNVVLKSQYHFGEKIIGEIKKALTVRNPELAAKNLLGSWTQLIVNGSIFYGAPDFNLKTFSGTNKLSMNNFFNHFITKDGDTSRDALTEQLLSEAKEYLSRVKTPTQFQTLMYPSFSSGPEKAKQLVTEALKFMDNLLPVEVNPASKADTISRTIGHVLEKQEDFYTLSDDAPKFLTYLVNREISTAKYELKYKDLEDPQEFRNKVLAEAIPEAVDRTIRENVDFSALPRFARSTHPLIMVVRPSFVSHSLQQAKIMGESVRLYGEDKQELLRVESDNSPEAILYKELLQKRQRSRLISAVAIPVSLTLKTAYNLAPVGILGAGATYIWSYFRYLLDEEEDPDKPFNERRTFTPAETLALLRIPKYFSYDGSVVDTAIPIRDGNKFYTLNDSSIDLTMTFAPVYREIMDGDLSGASRVIVDLLLTNSDSLPAKILNAFTNDDLTLFQAGMETMRQVAGYLGTPFQPIYSLVTGKKYNGQEVDRGVKVLNLGGIPVKQYDFPQQAGYLSSRWAREKNSSQVKDLVDTLSSTKSPLSERQIQSLISTAQVESQASFLQAKSFVDDSIAIGANRSDVRGWLKGGISQQDIESLLRGENFYDENLQKKVDKLLTSFTSTGSMEGDKIVRDNINKARILLR